MFRPDQLKPARPHFVARAPRRLRGATLIETLIALLIFALGMLGIAGLLAATVRYQSGNTARNNISLTISDLSERIRSNVAGANGFSSVVAGTSTIVLGTGYVYTSNFGAQSSKPAVYSIDCSTTACTQAQRAEMLDKAIGRLAGMQVVASSYSVSTALRERHEAELVAQAIDRFSRDASR